MVTLRAGNPTRAECKEAGGKEACSKCGAHPGKNAFSDNKWGAHLGKTAFLETNWVTLVTSSAGNPIKAESKAAGGKEPGGKDACNKWGAHPGKNAFSGNKWGAHPGKTTFLDNK